MTRPAAWWSADGAEWSVADVSVGSTDAYQLGPILDLGDRLISFATDNPTGADQEIGTILFTSDDGRAWEPLADGRAPEGGTVRDVSSGGPGYVAVGSAHSPLPEGQGAMVWTSDDGVNWAPVPDAEGLGPGLLSYGYVNAIASDGSVFVAVGARWDDQMTAHPGVWRSNDGLSWEEVASAAQVDEFPSAIAASANGFVMGGVASGTGMSVPVAWSSTDGRSWARVQVEPGQGGGIVDIAVGPEGMVGVGDGAQAAGAWWSSDGSAWQAFEMDVPAEAQQPATWRVVPAGNGYVAVGWARVGPGAERRALVWIGE